MRPQVEARRRILQVGINPYVKVSAKEAVTLRPNGRGPLPVLARFNDDVTAWRTNLMPAGDGSYRLYLHGSMRKSAKVDVGDVVQYHLEFDDEYALRPTDTLPPWFRTELDADSTALDNWDRLTPSLRKEFARYLGALKSPAAQQRNLVRALGVLRGDAGRYLGRDWVDGQSR